MEGSVYVLKPGRQYLVIQTFSDFYWNVFERGKILRFRERHFLPYDGGHTIVFEERSLYLQEEKNQDILENSPDYIVPIVSLHSEVGCSSQQIYREVRYTCAARKCGENAKKNLLNLCGLSRRTPGRCALLAVQKNNYTERGDYPKPHEAKWRNY